MSERVQTAESVTTEPIESRPNWLDETHYPFESNYLETGAGRVHYVDEGSGPTLLMLHGNPTWSFLYRHLIRGLSDEYRCVAPDYLGFGLSDKPQRWTYRPADHARVVEQFVDELDLSNVTLFLHDWGGPIGVDYAIRHAENVSGFVVMNTAAWPLTESRRASLFSKTMGSRVGGLLNRRFDLLVNNAMPMAFGNSSRLTPTIRRHYLGPQADPAARRGAWVFVRELLGSTAWLSDLWERRNEIADKPALLCWGMQGPLFGTEALHRWQALFPAARTVAFPAAGHFVQEENGTEMVPDVRAFLEERF